MAPKSLFRLTKTMNGAMVVVTAEADGDRSGCLVGFSTQVAIQPPRFLVGISRNNHTFGVARRSGHLAVHLLARRDLELARLFGGETDDEVDKFERCSWRRGPHGMPILDDAVAWMVGETLDCLDFGDHVGYLLDPVDMWFADGVDQDEVIHFADVLDVEPGHEP